MSRSSGEKVLRLLIVFGSVIFSEADSKTNLSGIEHFSLNASRTDEIWIAKGINASTGLEVRIPATVPGGIYTDLEENGILASKIYHEYNDLESKWVGRTNWTYVRNFTVTPSLLKKAVVVLICEGLDTVSEVFINGIKVGRSENMFVRYMFHIKDALKTGQNEIKIEFQSPVEYARTQYDNHEVLYGYAVRPERLVPEFRGENKAQFIRKMQSSFSWDWGPSYPSSGIWKDIYIEGYNGAVVRDVLIFSTPSKSIPDDTSATEWNVTARVYYDCALEQQAILKWKRQGSVEVSRKVLLTKGERIAVDIQLTESGEEVKLWWPNGYGQQNLYAYRLLLEIEGTNESSSRQLRLGFRTVELVEDFVDAQNLDKGREFYFTVNGVKLYSKGSNSIPLHVLPERITESQTEWLLRAAKMSHQNMIRVWGGGMYESDTFYDWADEYGILIWEDFMFACALYPATPEFLENVRLEVETQVKRLQYRTSLALWAGNNENEGGLVGNWFGFEPNYKSDYIKLYIGTIKNVTENLDPSRRYISSSPTNGKKTEEEGWIAWKPSDLKYGDIHAYNYYDDNWNWRIYTRGRYTSEYGYQSFPHFDTLMEVADNISTWSWNSPMLEHRQRHPGGQTELKRMIQSHFPLPKNYNSPEALPHMLYLAQLTQVMGQKTQTEFYRRLQDKLYEDGTGHNMGSLYWQLNDVWEGCSWSSVEVNGRWKLQMYYAQKFFAPVLVSPYRLNGDVHLELISDSRTDLNGTLKVQIFKLGCNNTDAVYEAEVEVNARFLTSKGVFQISQSTLKSLDCDKPATVDSMNPCIVYTRLRGTPDNFLFLQYPTNKLSLRDPKLQITSVFAGHGDGRTLSFSLTTEAVAPFVFLTVKGDHRGYFSDNGFILASPNKNLTYYSENGITAYQFLANVEVVSLYNVIEGMADILTVQPTTLLGNDPEVESINNRVIRTDIDTYNEYYEEAVNYD